MCLGHRIDTDGIHPKMEQVKAIAEASSTKDVKELRISNTKKFISTIRPKVTIGIHLPVMLLREAWELWYSNVSVMEWKNRLLLHQRRYQEQKTYMHQLIGKP
ncbi:hypothetical protein T03_16713 [Trichinella britovi]|uniref:Uncharacterized protein n=1 Tax=Trichinella britovi TaxID=45882 RepID=A0A0V1CIG3_TRIBR|nr:hypothetical protein T03_16713 [Trichinella britovi]